MAAAFKALESPSSKAIDNQNIGSSLIDNDANQDLPEPVGIAAQRQAAKNADVHMTGDEVINAKAQQQVTGRSTPTRGRATSS